jgi:uncharacterized protein (DUF1697 family)
MSLEPRVNLVLGYHTGSNGPRLAAAVNTLGARFLALECARAGEILDPDARGTVNALQVDLQQFSAGNDPMEPGNAASFYGTTMANLTPDRNGHHVVPIIVDMGRLTNTACAMELVRKSYDAEFILIDLKAANGDPIAYITERAKSIAASLSYREGMVAEQVSGLVRSIGAQEKVTIIEGSAHFMLHHLLEKRGIPTTGVFVDPADPRYDLALATRMRIDRDNLPSKDAMTVMGAADMLNFSSRYSDADPRVIASGLRTMATSAVSSYTKTYVNNGYVVPEGHEGTAAIDSAIRRSAWRHQTSKNGTSL